MFIAESQYREKIESMTEKKDWISILNEASVVGFRAKIETFALYRNVNFYKCKEEIGWFWRICGRRLRDN